MNKNKLYDQEEGHQAEKTHAPAKRVNGVR